MAARTNKATTIIKDGAETGQTRAIRLRAGLMMGKWTK